LKRALSIFILSVQVLAQTGVVTLKRPIALDRVQPSGDLFAVDATGHVYRLSDDSKQLTILASFSLPAYVFPSDLTSAVISKEQVLLVSGLNQKSGMVGLYTTAGSLKRMWRCTHVLGGIDYNPASGVIFAASSDSDEIYQASLVDRTEEMHFLGQVVGARHLGPVLFDPGLGQLIVGEIDSGDLYTLDVNSHRSRVLARGLGSPQALMLSADGQQLFVADAVGRKIYMLDLAKPAIVPKLFSQITQFREPVGLALLSAGRIAVADDRADAIFVIGATGSLQGP
jgi:SMP-30/Gluconolactonase/LRE-like region